MNIKRQSLRMLVTLVVLGASISVAVADKTSGTLKNGSWRITNDGELNISVNGEMSNFKEGRKCALGGLCFDHHFY